MFVTINNILRMLLILGVGKKQRLKAEGIPVSSGVVRGWYSRRLSKGKFRD